MSASGFVLVGDERLPYSLAAIHAVGLSNGDRVPSMDVFQQLSAAEFAYSDALAAIYRAQIAAMLG